MTKKEYILKILETLKDDWPIAKGLAIVILELENDKLLNAMYKIFNKSINQIKDKKLKVKFKNALEKVKQMQKQEQKEKQEDLGVLENLEKELELI